MGRALVAISAPVYWLGLVSLYLFSKDIGKFPLFEGQGAYPTAATSSPTRARSIPSLILPWFVLAASFAAIYARFLRGNLLETMSEDYIRTARAKGLRERTVVFATACARRSRRSSRSSASTSASCSAARSSPRRSSTSPASGAWPTTRSRRATCRPSQGTVLIGAFFIIFLNLIVDIVYAFLDPRVRY